MLYPVKPVSYRPDWITQAGISALLQTGTNCIASLRNARQFLSFSFSFSASEIK